MKYIKDNTNIPSDEKLLNLTEVALLVGVSVQTVNSWYKWKALHPEHEYAKLIPEYTRIGNRRTRFWKHSDIWRLIEFKSNIAHGCRGFMGDVTQKYVSKKSKEI